MKTIRHLRPLTASCVAATAGLTLIPVAGHASTAERAVPASSGTAAAVASPSAGAVRAPAGSPSGVAVEARAAQEVRPNAAVTRLTARQRVVNQVNHRRRNRGLRTLRMVPKPRRVAKWQSNYQARIRTVTHRGPVGGNAGDRLTYAGYPWWMWGEAVAGGYSRPKAVVRAWMNSPSHRDILMHPRARHIGVWGQRDSNGRKYWTLVVANR